MKRRKNYRTLNEILGIIAILSSSLSPVSLAGLLYTLRDNIADAA
jgi:hypothetical protein